MSTNPQWKTFQPPDVMHQDSAILDFKNMTTNGEFTRSFATSIYYDLSFKVNQRKHSTSAVLIRAHGSAPTFPCYKTNPLTVACTVRPVQQLDFHQLAPSRWTRITSTTAAATPLAIASSPTGTTVITNLIPPIWVRERLVSSRNSS